MASSIEEICAKVLKRVSPSESERKKVLELAQKLTENVEKEAKKKNVEARVRVEGSVAKNTWLKDSPEIDVFMQVPTTTPREAFGTACLEVAKKATEGYEQIERFAEHPYLEAIVDDVYVNIVPCYVVKQGEWVSATDRTPFHTDYIKTHLNKHMEKEVRLLKRFMKGIGVYGAEIKVGGFSGYLCELLVLNYGSFVEVLLSAANWKEKTIIDYKEQYARIEDAKRIFEEPLIMVDPVDKERNVAAAVTQERLDEFVAASREFLKTPNMKFFYPPIIKSLNSAEIVNRIRARGSAIVFIKFNGIATVPDILWGQLYKSQRALRKIVTKHDFKILRDSVWSNEKNLNMFVFEVQNRFIPNMKHHLGPPLQNRLGCEKFLLKHTGADSTVSGPRIEDGRWVVDVQRTYSDVVKLLNEKLEDGGKRDGVAELVSKAISESGEVLVNDQVLKLYSLHPDFAQFLTKYLEGKPRWLT
ncbi:MAG: CCA tRNA nucleotidyltransferase [Candidatus Bathyarchaeum sp.]|nr:MAG: CCA tRNA nucleotidyltransferase [Candidatus Bathyarchaeum sp.]